MKNFIDLMNESYKILAERNKEVIALSLSFESPALQTALPIVCADGYQVSIQAGWANYCSPRRNFDILEKGDEKIILADYDMYDSFELGFPSHGDQLIAEYAEEPENLTGTVYSNVPKALIHQLMKLHGGAVGFYSPEQKRLK